MLQSFLLQQLIQIFLKNLGKLVQFCIKSMKLINYIFNYQAKRTTLVVAIFTIQAACRCDV